FKPCRPGAFAGGLGAGGCRRCAQGAAGLLERLRRGRRFGAQSSKGSYGTGIALLIIMRAAVLGVAPAAATKNTPQKAVKTFGGQAALIHLFKLSAAGLNDFAPDHRRVCAAGHALHGGVIIIPKPYAAHDIMR